MNQRREPRFPIDRAVDVTVFGTPDIHLQALVRNVSGRGLALEVAEPLASGTALKITLEDDILLGEVIYCRAQEDRWYAGVELEHALCGLADIAAALRGFSDDGSGTERKNAVQYAHGKHEQ